MNHCPWCRPCCCRDCDPWRFFVMQWGQVAEAIKYPDGWGSYASYHAWKPELFP